METFTIGQLAQAAGVNLETIRYYERRGLLRDPPRTGAGYRQYSGTDLWRLQFIARAKGLGFTLGEVTSLLGQENCRSAESIRIAASGKIRALDKQQRELADIRARLERLIGICEDPASEDCAALQVSSVASD
jgi:DNA-binding transcriptional MerR regulator